MPLSRIRFGRQCAFVAALLGALLLVMRLDAGEGLGRFRTVSLEQGLSQVTVYCILQDPQGFLWFGTQDGLNRYDGRSIKQFHSGTESGSLGENWITDLCLDNQNRIWVGTPSYLNLYLPESGTFQVFPLGEKNKIYTMVLSEEHLYIGTNKGLLRMALSQPGKFEQIGEGQIERVSTICLDRHNHLWVGTFGGKLFMLSPATNSIRELNLGGLAQPLGSAKIFDLYFDEQTTLLWVATSGNLLYFDPIQEKAFLPRINSDNPDPMPRDLRRILKDPKGRLWCGSRDGLFCLGFGEQGGEIQSIARFIHQVGDPYSLSSDNVLALFSDREEALWVGTYGGAQRLNPTSEVIGYLSSSRGQLRLASEDIHAILVDHRDQLWIGSEGGGVDLIDKKHTQVRNIRLVDDDNPEADRIRSLAEDPLGQIWVGTFGMGLGRIQNIDSPAQLFQSDPDDPGSLGDNQVPSLYSDLAGNLWVATDEGLDVIPRSEIGEDLPRFRHFRNDPKDPHSLVNNQTSVVFQSKSEQMWVGTIGGLTSFKMADASSEVPKFKSYLHDGGDPKTLSWNDVLCLQEDSNGELWVGTSRGLNRTKDPEQGFRRYFVSDGLPNDTIYGCQEDKHGFMWFSTNYGLARYNSATGLFKIFTREDGLQENEFNMGAHFKSRKGELFFGGIAGLSWFQPGHLPESNLAPLVAITELSIFNRPVEPRQGSPILSQPIEVTKQIQLNHTHEMFSFRFAALHQSDPARNRYAYQMEGFDKDWIYTDADTALATYTHLPAGAYKFRVKAQSKEGVWGTAPIGLGVKVDPPPWRTVYAYSAYSLVLIVLVSLYLRSNRKILAAERQVSERLREANDLKDQAHQQMVLQEKMAGVGTLVSGVTHEIKNPIGFVHMSSQNLSRDLEKLRQQLDVDYVTRNPLVNRYLNRIEEHVNIIEEGTGRVNEIVADLQLFARVDVGEHRTISLAAYLHSTINLVRVNFKGRVNFIENLEDPLYYSCRGADFSQVFMNLVVNACQAISEKQQIQQVRELGELTITTKADKDWSYITFTDTGIGIQSKNRSRIFEPFFTTKQAGDGTGLGLAITYKIIAQYNGRLDMESVPGEGTTFTLILPTLKKKEPAATAE